MNYCSPGKRDDIEIINACRLQTLLNEAPGMVKNPIIFFGA